MHKLVFERSSAFLGMLRTVGISDLQYESIRERAIAMLDKVAKTKSNSDRYEISLVPVHKERLEFLITGFYCPRDDIKRFITVSDIFPSQTELLMDISRSLQFHGFRRTDGTCIWDAKSGCSFSLLVPADLDRQE